MIQTVLGPVEPERLGRTLSHEHVICAGLEFAAAFGSVWMDVDRIRELAVRQFTYLREQYGVQTVVDATPINLCRLPELLREVSLRSGVNIVCATGLYHQPCPSLKGRDPEKLAAYFIRECREGIRDTGIRPGVLKAASETPACTPENETVLRTMGIVQRETGLPLIAHSNPSNRAGRYQLELFRQSGADLRRVCIAHCSDTDDLGYLEELLDSGCWIGIDRYKIRYGEEELRRRALLTVRLLERGHLNRLLLSHDGLTWLDFGEKDFSRDFDDSPGAEKRSEFLPWFEIGLPILRANGVTEEQIRTLLSDNPRRFLCGE